MPKTIWTPRDELVCGKLDVLYELATAFGSIIMIDLVNDIRHDCERMEAKLISRKEESKKPAQDDGKAEVEWPGELTIDIVNAGLEVGFNEDNASEKARDIYRNNAFANRIAHTIFAELKRRIEEARP